MPRYQFRVHHRNPMDQEEIFLASMIATGADHAILRLGLARLNVVRVEVWNDGRWETIEPEV